MLTSVVSDIAASSPDCARVLFGRVAALSVQSPVRALHTIHSLDNRLGGAVHAGLNVCRSLVEAGCAVQVLATHGRSDELGYLADTYSAVRWSTVPRCFPARWYNGRKMKARLKELVGRHDLVELHAVFSFVTIRAAAAARRAGVPYFLRPPGSLDPFDLRKRTVLKRLLGPLLIQPVLQGAAGVICTSATEAARIVTYGAAPRKLVVPLPVPPAAETPAGARADFRARHRIPPEATVVLFLSRLDYKKGLEFVIPALATLRRKHGNLWFLLVGSGVPAFESGIQRRLEACGALDWTVQTGFLAGAEKQAALAASDIFVLPSLNENFGMAIVEAMRAGLPVVISDQVYIHQEIANAGAGVVCATSAESCTQALRQVLSLESPQRTAMGERGRALACTVYSPEAATHRLLAIYREVLAGNDQRTGMAGNACPR